MTLKTKPAIVILIIVLFVLSACSSKTNEPSKTPASKDVQASPTASGGTLKIAVGALPATLDPHSTTAAITGYSARQIYEGLVTVNSRFEVVPMLAKSYEISKDGKIVTFILRQGVKFHNGKEMKAEDVVASMQKWQKTATAGKSSLGNSTWEVKDDYTVVLHVETPSYVLMFSLAEMIQFAAIMPKEVVQGADATGVKEYIGTGPFQFKELKPNQYLLLTKFKDYQPLSATSADVGTFLDGLSGKKEALVDELYIYNVPDSSTAINGLVSGQYDVVQNINFDALPQIDNNKNIVQVIYPAGNTNLLFNNKQGVFANVKARQAVNMALDKKAIMAASFTKPEYYRLHPGLMGKDQTAWYVDAGKENYSKYDVGQAKQLLKEAGYNGEEVRIIVPTGYPVIYNTSVATQQQLQQIGMKVKLDVIDFSTWLERRAKPDQWEIFVSQYNVKSTPVEFPFLDSKVNYPGWTNSPEIDKLLTKIRASTSQKEAKSAFEELQKVFWDEYPVLVIGETMQIDAISNKVKGFKNFNGPLYWNTSITR